MADKKEVKMLTVKEVSKIKNMPISTISAYCRDKKFPNARKEITPFGEFWLIPETDLVLVEKRDRGRPKETEK